MKHRILLLSSVLVSVAALGACSQEPISIEEKMLMSSFSAVNAAQAYDHVCQGDTLAAMEQSDPRFANLSGNIQMLAYRIGWFMHERRPNDTVDEAAKRLQDIQKLVAAKTENVLGKEGCEGEAAQDAKKSFDLYTPSEPVAIDRMINEAVVKSGGTLAVMELPAQDLKTQKDIEKLEGASDEQLESMKAAQGAAPPVDTEARAYPAWGEWVRNQFRPGAALKKPE